MTPEEVVCDPEFRAFCRHWREHGRCPLPLADWLRDRGLDGPADAAAWAAVEPDRPGFGDGNDVPGGVCPNDIPGIAWAWGRWNGPTPPPCRQYVPYAVWGRIPKVNPGGGTWSGGLTFLAAVVGLLFAWADPGEGAA